LGFPARCDRRDRHAAGTGALAQLPALPAAKIPSSSISRFFLPMATTRTLLLHAGPIHDIGTISLVVTIIGVVGALAIWRIALAVHAQLPVRASAAFWIAPKKPRATLQAGGVGFTQRQIQSSSPGLTGRPSTP